MSVTRIGGREVGDGAAEGPYIIAELGVNHDGSVERALELVRGAKRAGVDAVKLQLFRAEMLMSRASRLAAYQENAGERDPVEMLRRLELSVEEMGRVVESAHELGLHAIVTVFSVEIVEEAVRLAWDGYKTASPDIINRPLLDALAAAGRPLIVSTGASTMEEVRRAVRWLEPARKEGRLAVLQCVSAYPTPIGSHAIGGVYALREAFDCPIGYSDHTADVRTGLLAVANGATVLEKHLTYDRGAAGPDHAASLDVEMMTEYVTMARRIADMGREAARLRELLGSVDDPEGTRQLESAEHAAADARARMDVRLRGFAAVKEVLPIERDVRLVSRQSVVSRRAMKAGEVLRREDLTIKRPGTGVAPYEVGELIGRTLVRDVEGDVPVVWEDVGSAGAEGDGWETVS